MRGVPVNERGVGGQRGSKVKNEEEGWRMTGFLA